MKRPRGIPSHPQSAPGSATLPAINPASVAVVRGGVDVFGARWNEDHGCRRNRAHQNARDPAGRDGCSDLPANFVTVLAAHERVLQAPWIPERDQKQQIVEAIAVVADRLGNTPSVCRTCYTSSRQNSMLTSMARSPISLRAAQRASIAGNSHFQWMRVWYCISCNPASVQH